MQFYSFGKHTANVVWQWIDAAALIEANPTALVSTDTAGIELTILQYYKYTRPLNPFSYPHIIKYGNQTSIPMKKLQAVQA